MPQVRCAHTVWDHRGRRSAEFRWEAEAPSRTITCGALCVHLRRRRQLSRGLGAGSQAVRQCKEMLAGLGDAWLKRQVSWVRKTPWERHSELTDTVRDTVGETQ